MCSCVCLSHSLSARMVGQTLLEFSMEDFLLKAFGQFQFYAILTYDEVNFDAIS